MKKPRILVLGAGYGGLMAVTSLQRKVGRTANITLVDKHEYHYEATWLHEVAAGNIDADYASYMISEIIDHSKVKFIQDKVVRIDLENKYVKLKNGQLSYDYLVIGLGFQAETYGIPGLQEYAHLITNIHSSLKLKTGLEKKFEDYGKSKPDKPLTIAVGGSGFTGVEYLGELVHSIPKLCKKYNVSKNDVRVLSIEAGHKILPEFDGKLAAYAKNYLEDNGVQFLINTAIKECYVDQVTVVSNGEVKNIMTDLLIWTAGVRGNEIIQNLNVESLRSRIIVDPYLRVPGYKDTFVVGDCALLIDESKNKPIPPTAQIGMQQGQYVAKYIAALIKEGELLTPFSFNNKGCVCSIGYKKAIGIVFGYRIQGTFASLMKRVIENRSLFLISGIRLVLKKRKFRFF
ncbi:NAD(P)/FAD-dependent oxidoreductase [Bacillus sp. Marseille-P3661]|uniref:NAD(P)/FAD-dependent oxidoreductase n=1 Tax=Bacillus sp. Marseille-P3661 TaxID=1936234 RepID=UPI000C866FC2|nr:NAD(P)/FAD-dependent oxidoreductase [Bacillus sp. Marseille-P3661]